MSKKCEHKMISLEVYWLDHPNCVSICIYCEKFASIIELEAQNAELKKEIERLKESRKEDIEALKVKNAINDLEDNVYEQGRDDMYDSDWRRGRPSKYVYVELGYHLEKTEALEAQNTEQGKQLKAMRERDPIYNRQKEQSKK